MDFKIINPRELFLEKNGYQLVRDENFNIVGIQNLDATEQLVINDTISLTVDDTHYIYSYRANQIKEINDSYEHGFKIIEETMNDSFLFLFPFIVNTKYRYLRYFVFNTYFSRDNSTQLVVVTKFLGNGEYKKFENDLFNNKNFLFVNECGLFSIFAFSIPEEYKNILDLYCTGKFSSYPQDAKDRIFAFFKRDSLLLKVDGILNKTKEYKDYLEKELNCKIPKGEFHGIPKNEIIDSDYLKNHLENSINKN